MKKFLQFAGLIGAVLGLIAFILYMVTPAIQLTGAINGWYGGTLVIFGSGQANVAGHTGDADGELAWVALLAWIFSLVGWLILCVLFVLPLLKVKALEKFDRLLTFIAGGLLIAGGILAFFTVPAYVAANGGNSSDGLGLGAGWVIASILAIVGGGVAVLPPILSLVGKK